MPENLFRSTGGVRGVEAWVMKSKRVLVLCLYIWIISAVAEEAPRSFAYVLQAESLAESREAVVLKLKNCGRDWIVLDALYSGEDGGAWTKAELAEIRAGKSGRKILGYLSIGEAENYRAYWKKEGMENPPDWLGPENPEWPGNYKVKYWSQAWQEILLTDLEKLMSCGFDGVYLDLVDAFEFYEYDAELDLWCDHRLNPVTGQSYRKDMVDWVGKVAGNAKKRNKDALVIPQNGSQLLKESEYISLIHGIGVEDLFANGNRMKRREESAYVLGFLALAKQKGLPILEIEYVQKPKVQARLVEKSIQAGTVLLQTDRELTTLGASEETP